MKLFKSVDEKLKDLGFELLREDFYGCGYEKTVFQDGGNTYNHMIDIGHKANGKHLIQSYQEGINKDGLNNVVGLTYEETNLVMKKYRQMKRKYKW